MIDFENGKLFKLHKDNDAHEKEIAQILIPNETVIGSYTVVRDYVVFTNKRIISVNKQGMTGTKKNFTSMPYSKITAFSVETAGILGYDGEIELFFTGLGKVTFEFTGTSDIFAIGQAISQYVLE